MTIDPFGARIEGGRLYGRGACDIKGGMAAMLATFARLVRANPAGAVNVLLACTVDEEHTFLGVQRLVRDGLRADLAVTAEPTQLHIVNAHKGVVRWHLETRGRSCHSSEPERGINAIYQMARVLPAIDEYAETLRTCRKDPLLGPPTLSVGRIEGGTSVNTVPDRCRIEIDRRVIPGEDPLSAPGQLSAFLRKVLPAEWVFSDSEPWLHAARSKPDWFGESGRRAGKGDRCRPRFAPSECSPLLHRCRDDCRSRHPCRCVRPGRHCPSPYLRRIRGAG